MNRETFTEIELAQMPRARLQTLLKETGLKGGNQKKEKIISLLVDHYGSSASSAARTASPRKSAPNARPAPNAAPASPRHSAPPSRSSHTTARPTRRGQAAEIVLEEVAEGGGDLGEPEDVDQSDDELKLRTPEGQRAPKAAAKAASKDRTATGSRPTQPQAVEEDEANVPKAQDAHVDAQLEQQLSSAFSTSAQAVSDAPASSDFRDMPGSLSSLRADLTQLESFFVAFRDSLHSQVAQSVKDHLSAADSIHTSNQHDSEGFSDMKRLMQDELASLRSDLQAEIEKAKAEVTQASERGRSGSVSTVPAQEALEKMEETRSTLEKRVDGVEEALRGRIDKLDQSFVSRLKELDKILQGLASIKPELLAVREEQRKLEAEMVRWKQDKEAKEPRSAIVNAADTKTRAELKAVQEAQRALEKQVSTWKGLQETASSADGDITNKVQELTRAVQAMRSEVGTLRKTVHALEASAGTAKNAGSALTSARHPAVAALQGSEDDPSDPSPLRAFHLGKRSRSSDAGSEVSSAVSTSPPSAKDAETGEITDPTGALGVGRKGRKARKRARLEERSRDSSLAREPTLVDAMVDNEEEARRAAADGYGDENADDDEAPPTNSLSAYRPSTPPPVDERTPRSEARARSSSKAAALEPICPLPSSNENVPLVGLPFPLIPKTSPTKTPSSNGLNGGAGGGDAKAAATGFAPATPSSPPMKSPVRRRNVSPSPRRGVDRRGDEGDVAKHASETDKDGLLTPGRGGQREGSIGPTSARKLESSSRMATLAAMGLGARGPPRFGPSKPVVISGGSGNLNRTHSPTKRVSALLPASQPTGSSSARLPSTSFSFGLSSTNDNDNDNDNDSGPASSLLPAFSSSSFSSTSTASTAPPPTPPAAPTLFGTERETDTRFGDNGAGGGRTPLKKGVRSTTRSTKGEPGRPYGRW